MIVDLIYVDVFDCRKLSCALIHESDKTKDKLLGPVPAKGAIAILAPMLATELPDRFLDAEAAASFLTFLHFRNMSIGQNGAGQAYPFRIKRPS